MMEKKHKHIKAIFFDVDGTMTDGKIYISENGELFKAFNVKDGYAINIILKKKNIIPIVITGRNSKIVEHRCNEIGIKHIYQGIEDKVLKAYEILDGLNLSFDECAYIGDDLNDLNCMELCNLKGCPSDAADEVMKICDFISKNKGGNGAVREFIEWI